MDSDNGNASETGPTQWAHALGTERHVRDESAARTARSEQQDAARTIAASVDRWTAIVAGIRRAAHAYNDGAKRVVLSVVEQSGQPTVTIAAGGDGAPALTAALEGNLICVQARDACGVLHALEIRLRPDRDDDGTVAYVLQNWMQRL